MVCIGLVVVTLMMVEFQRKAISSIATIFRTQVVDPDCSVNESGMTR